MLTRRRFAAAGAASLAAPAVAARAEEPVTITFWTWTPDIQAEIDLFERTHPTIRVNAVNAGQGVAQYTKMRTALKAGTGLPDVAQVEYHLHPTFQLAGALLDLAPYGAGAIAQDYLPWAWQAVSRGDKVFGIPSGQGPVGLLYRQDIFDRHKLSPPQTWEEYGESAIRLRRDAPDVFLGDLTLNNATWVYGCLWQAGWNPFHLDGTSISIAVNDAAARRVSAWWQTMLDAKALDTMPGFTSEWYTAFDRGRFATWFIAVWGPVFLAQFAKNSAGLWRAAPPPLWDAGKYVSANMGGSTYAVTTQSRHPKEAAEFAMWLVHDPASVAMLIEKQFSFPTLKSTMKDPAFAGITYPFYGGQKINEVFIDSANHVDRIVEFPPFEDFLGAELTKQLSAAAGDGGRLVQALDRVQDSVVRYARQQGFTVRA
jgi:multiple sugar transport system substrate-binding protein